MDNFAIDWMQSLRSLRDIMIAFALALPVGWEREKEHRAAGVRTFPLVAVASCCYILVTERLLGVREPNLDRVMQGLITGIGFIGGGAIFRAGDSVRGTATAASIWLVGALGAAVAAGAYDLAIILSIVNYGALKLLYPVKRALDRQSERD
jgi:putative Mg2+ transporter-C (MgtC) family protein